MRTASEEGAETAAGLREHASTCFGPEEVTTHRMSGRCSVKVKANHEASLQWLFTTNHVHET